MLQIAIVDESTVFAEEDVQAMLPEFARQWN